MPLFKLLKRAAAVFVGGLAKQPDWSHLPFVVLVKVFLYLNNSDKYHAALTCKSWLSPLSLPSVWQSGDFVFDTSSDHKAIRFVKMTGKTLRHIRAECRAGDFDFWGKRSTASSTSKVYQFLANLLNSRNNQILTFKLINLYSLEIDGQSRSFSEVAQLLTKVLEEQQQLRVLDLSNSQKSVENCLNDYLTVKQGMKLLTAAGKNCANTLKILMIARLVIIIIKDELGLLPQFRSAISGFSKLSYLDISYGYLNDDLLLSLATTSSLKVITIRSEKIPKLESGTTPSAWEKLTAACPELRTLFFIKPKYESYFQDATTILTPSMPLYLVQWRAGSVIAIENIEKFFQYVAQNFQQTLHHLEFQTGVRLDMKRFKVLFKSLQPCTNLDTLSLGLTFDVSDNVEMYMLAIRAAMRRCLSSCDLTLNVQNE
ncbi:uncharacterized protein LOC131955124 [Physella acuta]|uniref:uncharacterized protein LOC131955124 n=1 Tax=Physella acuta TaxID=109671 RepID=UPI0027DE82C5|nr:uncharacterized protein LOC131955124 [Physella acuta]